MKLVDKILKEAEIKVPDLPNTMTFWHGGNLEDYKDNMAQKTGRFQFGAGLYLIKDYQTAQKYAKGSRKLYMVTVELGKDIHDATIPMNVAIEFIKKYGSASKRKMIIQDITTRYPGDTLKAYIFNNMLLNHEAIKPAATQHLRQFLIDNGIDYEMTSYAGYDMMVLYNMKKIVKVQRINPKDTITQYDL